MSKSSATSIAYDLRPAKQTERRMLIDYLEALKEIGVQVSAARYIGMGGTKFYDFTMIHRFLAVRDLVSCEQNKTVAQRGNFNKPFALIDVRHESVGDYLRAHLGEKLAICWLDYDGILSEDVVSDVRVFAKSALPGSSLFVTVSASMSREMSELSERQRVEQLRDEYKGFASDIEEKDVEDGAFSVAIYKILARVFRNAFSRKGTERFEPHFRVSYRDGGRMITYGGSLLDSFQRRKMATVMRRRLPFLLADKGKPYEIRNYNITERERHLFEFSASARRNCNEANVLKSLGFSNEDLNGYRDMVRFLPRYFEAIN